MMYLLFRILRKVSESRGQNEETFERVSPFTQAKRKQVCIHKATDYEFSQDEIKSLTDLLVRIIIDIA